MIPEAFADHSFSRNGRQSFFKVDSRRSVKFRSCEATPGNVACTVHEYEKDDQRVLDSLFWTSDELQECFCDVKIEIEEIAPDYSEALLVAYKQALITGDIIRSFEEYWVARGLEHDIFPEAVYCIKRHRQAVLLCQEKLRQIQGRRSDGGPPLDEDNYTRVLHLASQKYSRPAHLMALKLAEADSFPPLTGKDGLHVASSPLSRTEE